MSDRFGTGFQKYSEYDTITNFISITPPTSEICIVIGSVGVVIAAYKVFNIFLNVSEIKFKQS